MQVVPKERPLRQLLLDVSETCRTELKTGIERVTWALVLAFLEHPPLGFRVKPVYLAEAGGLWHYRAALRFTRDLLGQPSDESNDPLAKSQAGDVLLVLDNSGDRVIAAEAAGLYTYYRNRGVAVYFTVYDLLPVRMPQYFPPGADHNFEKWLGVLLKMDGAVCISQTVADDFCNWARSNDAQSPCHVGWFHLGADIDNAAPTRGLPDDASDNLSAFIARPNFLMVGTIEPRKKVREWLERASYASLNARVVNQQHAKSLTGRVAPLTMDKPIVAMPPLSVPHGCFVTKSDLYGKPQGGLSCVQG